MSSVFEMLTQQLGGSAIEQISGQLGADRGQVEQAVPAALAALMGGLAKNTQRPDGAQALASALSSDHDGSALDMIGDLLSNPSAGPGEGILKHVLGAKRPAVESGLSQATGLDAGSAGQLLTMLAPLVMGALGKTQRQQGLDAGALASMLGGEAQQIRRAQPAGMGMLGQLLDADGDGQIADDVAKIGTGLLGKLFRKR
jgi:hypothetical protein